MILRLFVLLLIGVLVVFAFRFISQLQQINPRAATATVYYGAYVQNAPRNMTHLSTFESHAGKGVAILNWYQGWGVTDGTQNFQTSWMDAVRNHGSIPMITWEPWDYTRGLTQSDYSLKSIINGAHDAYITKWAQDSKLWGHPYFLRFAHEMNASNYPWSEKVNGNSSGEYILAWKHVRDIFTSIGATNITWVFSPNVEYAGTIPLEQLYPGDNYVDWTGMDGYNGGTALPWGGWQTFSQIFGPTYNHLVSLAPTKPIMISETASTEVGGSKANWIQDTYQTQIITNYPNIKAILWFNQNNSWETDWRIESSATAQSIFAASVASPYYTSNQYANLVNSPIPAPESLVTPTSTPTAISTPTPITTPVVTPTPVPTDIIPPQVSITTPQSRTAVSSKKTFISVSASDNIRVTKVDFYIDNVLKTSDLTSPYEYYWTINNRVQSGAHIIKAVVYDAANNSAASQITVYK